MGRRASLFLLLAVTCLWGATFPLVKMALTYASTGVFLSLRFALAFALLWALSRPGTRPRWDWAAVSCGVFLFLGYAFQTLGLASTLPARSAFLTSLSVVLVPILQWAITGAAPPSRVWWAVALAVAGLGLLLRPESAPLRLGDGLTFLCAVSFAAHVLALAKAVERQHPAAVNLVQMGIVALLSPLLVLLPPRYVHFSWPLLVALLITGIFASALAFGAMAQVLKVLPTATTGIVLAFEPVAAAALSALLGYEALSFSTFLGGAMVVLAVMLVAESPGESQPSSRRRLAGSTVR